MSSALFVHTGEGAHSRRSVVANLQASPAWSALEAALLKFVGCGLEAFLARFLGEHGSPQSPIVTTCINLLNADRWRGAGHRPALTLGHSIGEVAAAHAAALLSVHDAVKVAHTLGHVGCQIVGCMLHANMTRDELDAWSEKHPLCVAAVNGVASGSRALLLSVTLCGQSEHVEAWLAAHPDAKRLAPPHPWHHPNYIAVPSVHGHTFASLPEASALSSNAIAMFSANAASELAAGRVLRLDANYWRAWLTTPVDFLGALESAAVHLGCADCYLIETGAHDTLTAVAIATLASRGVHVVGTAASMRRGQPDAFWEAQRSQLEARSLTSGPAARGLTIVTAQIATLLAASFRIADVSPDAPLMQSGLDSDDL